MKVSITAQELKILMPYCQKVNRSPTSIIKEFIRSLPTEKDVKDDRETSSKVD